MQWVRSQVFTWMSLISVAAGLSGCLGAGDGA